MAHQESPQRTWRVSLKGRKNELPVDVTVTANSCEVDARGDLIFTDRFRGKTVAAFHAASWRSIVQNEENPSA